MWSLIAVTASLFLIIHSVNAGETTLHSKLVVKDAWSRATPAQNGVAYMKVLNQGHVLDRLVSGKTPVAKKIEFHTHSMKNGVMRMRRLNTLKVKPGEAVILEPGSHHVMLIGLYEVLKEGETFPLTLVFEKAGRLTTEVLVGTAGSVSYKNIKRVDHANEHMNHRPSN